MPKPIKQPRTRQEPRFTRRRTIEVLPSFEGPNPEIASGVFMKLAKGNMLSVAEVSELYEQISAHAGKTNGDSGTLALDDICLFELESRGKRTFEEDCVLQKILSILG